MDKYITRIPREVTDCRQGNQIYTYPNVSGNMVPFQTIYSRNAYGAEFNINNGMQHVNSGPFGVTYVPHMNTSTYSTNNLVPHQGQGHVVSGIDPMYMTTYSAYNAAHIVPGQQMCQQIPGPNTAFSEIPRDSFERDYQNRDSIGPNRNKKYLPHTVISETKKDEDQRKTPLVFSYEKKNEIKNHPPNELKKEDEDQKKIPTVFNYEKKVENITHQPNVSIKTEKTAEEKRNISAQTRGQIEPRSQALNMRAFSGDVAMVLKWRTVLQNVNDKIFYEVVSKCIRIDSEGSCAKILLLRGDKGPAMQVVYYESEFEVLPYTKLPCTVRVIGRMVNGAKRLHAFGVRLANNDDVISSQRRAAISDRIVRELQMNSL